MLINKSPQQLKVRTFYKNKVFLSIPQNIQTNLNCIGKYTGDLRGFTFCFPVWMLEWLLFTWKELLFLHSIKGSIHAFRCYQFRKYSSSQTS